MRVATRPSSNWNGRITSHPCPSWSDEIEKRTIRVRILEPDLLSLRSPEGTIGSHKDGQSPSHGVVYLEALRAGNESWNQTTVDRKSTRLNSSHLGISYAVFCLK